MKYDRINLMVPTYKRVENGKLPRFIDSAIKNADDINNICFTFLLNYDDHETYSYFFYNKVPKGFKFVILYTRERTPHLGKFYNDIYKRSSLNKPGTVVSMVGDDMEFITKGYDTAILNAMNKHNGKVIVYCNDDFVQGEKLCVNLFTSQELVNATKYPFMCELFAAYFIDTVWMKVGQKLNLLHYLKDVKIKHHHMSKNKSLIDETAQRLQKVKKSFNKGYKQVDEYVNLIIKNLKGVIK